MAATSKVPQHEIDAVLLEAAEQLRTLPPNEESQPVREPLSASFDNPEDAASCARAMLKRAEKLDLGACNAEVMRTLDDRPDPVAGGLDDGRQGFFPSVRLVRRHLPRGGSAPGTLAVLLFASSTLHAAHRVLPEAPEAVRADMFDRHIPGQDGPHGMQQAPRADVTQSAVSGTLDTNH